MNTNKIYLNDISFGLGKEITFLNKLHLKFGDDITQSKNKYSPYDFINDEYVIELKSRRCLKNTYDTTMILFNKVEKLKTFNKKILLCFSFIDQDCYYLYDDNDEFIVKRGGRKDRNCFEYNQYLYIPVNLLKDF
jgi:hypothetical protein